MMDLKQFVDTYNNTFVEVAGSANAQYQCVDLANAYIRDVLGLPIITGANAQDFPRKAGEEYEWHAYSQEVKPNIGDIIIWDLNNGIGHIAIVLESYDSYFVSFDQNWPPGSPSKRVRHVYNNITGWLRPKKSNKTIRMIAQIEKSECVWTKDGDAPYATLYILNEGGKRRKVKKSSMTAVAILYGQYGKLRRVEWPHIAHLDEGEIFDLDELVKTHPERFEAI